MSSSTIKYIESIKNKYSNLPSIDINNLVLKELTDECKHLKNLNEVHLKLNKELESKLGKIVNEIFLCTVNLYFIINIYNNY